MNPAPLVLLVNLLIRAFRVRRSRAAGTARGNWTEPREITPRSDEIALYLLGIAGTGLAALVLSAPLMPWSLPVLPVVILVAALPGVVRSGLLAAGQPLLASWLVPFDVLGWRRDRRGGRCAVLAMGLLRSPGDTALAARLDRELAAVPKLSAGTVLAAGIRALARGEVAEARPLLRLVAEFDTSKRPPLANRWAVDLLAGSAAADGDLELLTAELNRPRVPRTALGALLRLCVDRVHGRPVTERQLRAAWFEAGARNGTWTLVERVLAAVPEPPVEAEPADGTVDTALRATARLMGEAPPPLAAIGAAAGHWDRVLTRTDGFPGGAVGAGKLRAEVVEVLAERLACCREPVTAPPDSAVLREAVWAAGAERDAELTWLSDELGTRTDGRRALSLLDEVRAWCALVEAYQRVIDLAPQRASSSFARLYYPSVRHTVWLHNERDQAPLANAMYRVELRYAELVRHDSGVPLLQKNLRCGP